jgi:hypothetical protein
MVVATSGAVLVAGALGTLLQTAVFDLEEQQLLSEAGRWGYVAGACLVLVMIIPALVGITLGVRARQLGEHRLGTAGIVVNVLLAASLVTIGVANLLLG